MLYAIISDIHANLEATEACFREIDKLKPDRIICLGDLVDYCADPNEVMDLIRERCDVIIMGNHDEAQIDHYISDGFTENALITSIHTRSVLKQENKDYISTLKFKHSEKGLLFVHASPFNCRNYHYVLNTNEASINFSSFDEGICFIGHSHKPLIFRERMLGAKECGPEKIKKSGRYIINVGSVGQPRDGDPRLAFGIFDTDGYKYTLVRIEYDIKKAASKIIDEGLPAALAERLFHGL